MGLLDFFSKEKKEKLEKGIEKSSQSFLTKLGKAVLGKTTVDAELLDELEEILISSDVGVDTTVKIIAAIEDRVAKDKYLNAAELNSILKQEIEKLLVGNKEKLSSPYQFLEGKNPYILLVVGVNGVGKTTTIGKLAHLFSASGRKVVLGAADTFRAAAVDQLILWGERSGVQVISKGMNADPAAVAYESAKVGIETKADVVIIDTAGRLHTKTNLMQELSKIKRVIEKLMPSAPHDILLVLDGSTGQNAFIQAREFTKATDVSCLAVTKLDGTAKGGVVLGISDQFQIPVRFIGVGEGIEDLQFFDSSAFVDSFFSSKKP